MFHRCHYLKPAHSQAKKKVDSREREVISSKDKQRSRCLRASRDISTFMRYIYYKQNARHSKKWVETRYRLMVPKIKLNRRFIVLLYFLLLSFFLLPTSIFKSLVIYFVCWWRFKQFISFLQLIRMCARINFMSLTLIARRAFWMLSSKT